MTGRLGARTAADAGESWRKPWDPDGEPITLEGNAFEAPPRPAPVLSAWSHERPQGWWVAVAVFWLVSFDIGGIGGLIVARLWGTV